MLEFIAEIYLFKDNEGAMEGNGWSGMMPSLNMLDGQFLISRVLSDKPLTKEQWHEVIIQLPFGNEYPLTVKEKLKDGFEFKLNFGRKVLGKGIITCIY